MGIEGSTYVRDRTGLSGDDVAEGLMLVRASTLKMIRLQLAMERHDRRGMLEAVDDLVALDGRMRDCLAHMPADGDRLMFGHELDIESALLNREKLCLAAEVLCKPTDVIIEAEGPADDDWLGPRDLPVEQYEEPKRGLRWLAFALPALAAGVAGGAYAISLDEAAGWLAQAVGVLS